jgi:hypothetical protein
MVRHRQRGFDHSVRSRIRFSLWGPKPKSLTKAAANVCFLREERFVLGRSAAACVRGWKGALSPGAINRGGSMTPWSIIRPFVTGLTSFGVMFQALLLSVHFSLMAAPKADVASLGLNVICSEHGSIDIPAQDTPADQPSTCSLCLLCSKSGAGSLALLPQASIVLIVGAAQTLDLTVAADRLLVRYSPHPPSRGPPFLA